MWRPSERVARTRTAVHPRQRGGQMIDRQDIRDAWEWLRPWLLAIGSLIALMLIASGIGKAVVTTGEMASMLGGHL